MDAYYSFGMDQFQKEFISNLKFHRQRRNLTQARLAELCNVSNGTIVNIEAGKASPSFELILQLAKALEIHPAALFSLNYTPSVNYTKDQLEKSLTNMVNEILDAYFPQ